MGLHNLKAPKGAHKKVTRLGRGESSGHGKTSGRGNKGQKARKSGQVRIGFEGGQMPIQRRTPKRGFKNPFRKEYAVVNVGALAEHFKADAVVDLAALKQSGLVKAALDGIKVLGHGDIKHALTVKAHRFSTSAREKIEKAGGKIEIIAG
ncbi:MAG: 50S ribosomal protein L15 [Deltaproteobacteria bacterium]|nr:50S ribosomal protein L15 [Deltaproteobacteria bacterium]